MPVMPSDILFRARTIAASSPPRRNTAPQAAPLPAAIAQPQVAAAVVVTAILCPMLTNWISKRSGSKKKATFKEVEELVSNEDSTV